MKKIILIAVSALAIAGCTEQRNLYDISTPLLRIESDWIPSLNISDMSGNATAMLYRDGAFAAKSFFTQAGTTTANVSAGDYGVLVFNGQMFAEQQTNLDYISFRNTDTAETFEAFSERVIPNNRLVRTDDEVLINNEMAVLTSAYAQKRIEADPVFYLKYENGHRVEGSGITHIVDNISLTPIALSHYAQVIVELVHPASAAVANGSLHGFASSVFMASGMPSHIAGTHQLKLNHLTMTGLKTGIIESSTFVTFGPPLDLTADRQYIFELSVILINGEPFVTTVDISDQVRAVIGRIIGDRAAGIYNPANFVIEIEVELPQVEGGSMVGVTPWDDDEVITIKI